MVTQVAYVTLMRERRAETHLQRRAARGIRREETARVAEVGSPVAATLCPVIVQAVHTAYWDDPQLQN